MKHFKRFLSVVMSMFLTLAICSPSFGSMSSNLSGDAASKSSGIKSAVSSNTGTNIPADAQKLAQVAAGDVAALIKAGISKNVTNVGLNTLKFDAKTNKLYIGLSSKCSKVENSYFGDNKIVIDLYNTNNNLKFRQMDGNGSGLIRIRNAQFKLNPNISRIVLDLKTKIKYSLKDNGTQIIVTLNDTYKAPSRGSFDNPYTSEPQPQTKNVINYIKEVNSTIHISNLQELKLNLVNTSTLTYSFQIDSSYDVSGLNGISDKYISSIVITSGASFYTVTLNLNQGAYPVVSKSETGVDIVIGNTPPAINRIIVLDPGHGAKDSGAVGNGVVEKELNLDVALRVKKLLESNNIKVYMTRDTDTFFGGNIPDVMNDDATRKDLLARAQYANSLKADFFVSIHTNSADPASASGIETWYYPADGPMKKNLQKGKVSSSDLATSVQSEITKITGAVNRGIKSSTGLMVLKYTNVVPILVEVGFLTNSNEAANLKTDNYRQELAQGIANGILKAYDKN